VKGIKATPANREGPKKKKHEDFGLRAFLLLLLKLRLACRGGGSLAARGLSWGGVFSGEFFWLLLLGLFFVAGEFYDRQHRGVAAAVPEFYYSRVAAVAFFEAGGDFVEEFFYRVMGLHEGEGAAAGGEIALFAEGDHPIGDAAEFFGFGIGGFDSFVANQG
jgi:hypothetical protein